MKRWMDKIAVVTGVSTGIGTAVFKDLLKAGLVTIGLDYKKDKLESLTKSLSKEQKKRAHIYECDVTDEGAVNDMFSCILKNFKAVDVLVNNAGLLLEGRLSAMPCSEMKRVLDTNVMGVVYCSQPVIKNMLERKFDGHIIIVNSILGHTVPMLPAWNTYPASKHAVTALCEMYRQEFNNLCTKIKVTSVSPGLVDTHMVKDYKDTFAAFLKPQDISDGIMYALGTPPNVQVHELTIKPVGELI